MARTEPAKRPPDWVLDRYAPAVRELVLYVCDHPANWGLWRDIYREQKDVLGYRKPLSEWTASDVASAWRVIRHEERFLPPEYQKKQEVPT